MWLGGKESAFQCKRLVTQVQCLGWEDPLKEEMATHCSILTWRIPWTEEPGGPGSTGSQETVGHDWGTTRARKQKTLHYRSRAVVSEALHTPSESCVQKAGQEYGTTQGDLWQLQQKFKWNYVVLRRKQRHFHICHVWSGFYGNGST